MTDTEPFNEMLGPDGQPRAPYRALAEWFSGMSPAEMRRKSREAETIFRRLGITFAVYGTAEATERLIPFDIVPRVLAAAEWRRISAGIDQRVRALNAFLHDIYHRQEIIRAGRIPAELVIQNEAFLPEMIGFTPPRKVYAHIIGTDLVRVGEDEFYVLEDNTRTPSGVSYMLENRETMMRMFPELFQQNRVAPIEHYPDLLRETLESVAPANCDTDEPTVCILTPGIYNSAYFEHAFLADSMGVELCEARDLFVDDGKVFMRTTRAPERVHVIYRRIDDAFLDPLTFRPDSMLGVPGLFDAYRAGNVTICNAPGTGIADDKAVYAYLPEIIEFYTGQKPILQNVPTWNCAREDDLAYVLDHLPEIVVKEVHGSGGYGMLIGPTASKRELAEFKRRLKANPSNYIAQPTLSLSACPTHVASGLAPRHVDLRPYVLVGDKVRITPGGLTRVALKKGSLVVNSSQGGGTKDTWVLED
ncbi:circularly permuted type 2 ATP-grasp protein [Stappia stellulata]|uniref:circularly permuted type 2 ATP-grasp protein n=1 Tax=Stappia TaxID=152161 RepID=UPI001CD51F07|nr:circularly permuted type 2 ATP-grasp protein [Stappia stellulata]MCA1244498.1 circularly permuted type 2 ATP-grasp protein [Stappia stellulata]|eukprot:jgi/Tetstr1/425676/TSEL_016096.t1